MENEFDIIYWNDLKGKLKQNYPALTNSDLTWRHGTEEDLLWTIASKLGKTKRQLKEIIEKF
jgi:uncharacterized protein YjbJ (UPF0337 family)